METARYARASGTFGGEPRAYTRHVWYRGDEADFDADMHPLTEARSAADLDVDAFAEGRHSDIFEDPGSIAQFRQDVHSARMQAMVKDRWLGAGGASTIGGSVVPSEASDAAAVHDRFRRRTADELAADQVRMRAEVMRAMEDARQQTSLFDTNYARCIPANIVHAFLRTPETEDVCAALVPMLLRQTTLNGAVAGHATEQQMRRIMLQTGCTFASAETRTLPGHIARHAPPAQQDDTLYRGAYHGPHAHHNADADTTTVRILVFNVPPDQYQVRLVCLVVGHSTNAAELLCFRTFQFLRSQTAKTTEQQ